MVNLLITSSGSSWHGTQLQWKNRIILSIGEATWQEYPALLMRVASKIDSTITDYSDMYLVYLPQDKYTIQDRVIPAIEYYREKYGHGEWIKAHGWESYAEPARQLADA